MGCLVYGDACHMRCLLYEMFAIWDVCHMRCLPYGSVGCLVKALLRGLYHCLVFAFGKGWGEWGRKGVELRGGSGNGSVRSVVNDE